MVTLSGRPGWAKATFVVLATVFPDMSPAAFANGRTIIETRSPVPL